MTLNAPNCAFCRAVGRSENPGVPVLFGGHNLPPLVRIGLTDLPKSGSAMAPPAPLGDDTPESRRIRQLTILNCLYC